MMASPTVATAPAMTSAGPLPLDAAPFLVAEVGGSTQTPYDLYELTNAFVAGQLTPRSLIYRPDLTGQHWLPIASSHPDITAALAIPYVPPPAASTATAHTAAPPPSASSAVWYYIDSQRQRAGPVTAETLRALRRSGSLTDATLVWLDGLTSWLPFNEATAKTESTSEQHKEQPQPHDDGKEGVGSESDEDDSEQKAGTASSTTAAHPKQRRAAKKRKRAHPATNTAIYATGLPSDLTLPEAIAFFGKAGVIREDLRTHERRIKLYRAEDGAGKGDAVVNYMFRESVTLALTLLDGAEIRSGWPVTVTEAKFEHAAGAGSGSAAAAATGGGQQGGGAERSEKRSKVETILAKRQKEVALSWQGDDSTFHSALPAAPPTSTTPASSGLRIVVLTRLFSPAEAATAASTVADPSHSTDAFFDELTSDVGEELERRCGLVDKMTVYERSEDGVLVVKFKSVEAAERCVREMRGRKFGGREIGVEWWDGRDYSVRETAEEEKERLERFAAELESDET